LYLRAKKEDLNIDKSDNQQNQTIKQSEGFIVLGEKLEDPYALDNMIKAYENLKSTKSNTPNFKIKPTHKYIRFLPKNEKEWGILKSDTTLILYDYPLDYEIKNMGTYYHDPSLPKSSITWQYCVVPLKYNIPNIRNELLYEVFIPDDKGSKNSSELKQFLFDLEYESTKLTGNLPKNTNKAKGTKELLGYWRPKGTIKAWDNLIGTTTTYTQVFSHYECYDCETGEDVVCPEEVNPLVRIIAPIDNHICKRAVYNYIPHTTGGMYIPLNQVSVHARWFTNIKTDLTDENGYFETDQFLFEVNYAIKWERGEYDIRDGSLLQAWYNGPKKQGDWELEINGGSSIMYATMHRAAYKQFYGDNLDIRRPTSNGKTKLCYIDEDGAGIFWGDWIDYGILPDIKIWGKNNGSYKTVNQIFGTTTHELGHLSHWHLIGINNYAFTGEVIYESWATAVEWALTNDEYHTMGARFGGDAAINYYHEFLYQLRNVNGEVYTPIFIDLMDDYNQRVGGLINGVFQEGNTNLPNDLISVYTLSYIQNNILKDSRGISSLHTAVRSNKISNVTDNEIDELFALYW